MLGLIDESIECCRKVIALQPNHADAHYNLGTALMHQSAWDAAIACYETCLRIMPSHPTARFNLANALHRAGRWDAAMEAFRAVVDATPDNADAWYELGAISVWRQRYDDAIGYCRHAIALRPDFADAYHQLGAALHGKNQCEEAVKMYEMALHFKPALQELHYLIAAARGDSPPDRTPPSYVAHLFDGCADQFDETMVGRLEYHGPQHLFDAIERVALTQNRPLDILDLGCGTGLCGPLFKPFARRLVGIDLSERMLAKAASRNIYDELLLGDITDVLKCLTTSFDVLLAADVLIYVGDLAHLFELSFNALRSGGLFVFSIECAESGDSSPYRLQTSGRYAHLPAYIDDLARAHGWELLSTNTVALRVESGRAVPGAVTVLRKG